MSYVLDCRVVAYVTTSDYDQFLALQQELLLSMLQAVEHAGTGPDIMAAAYEILHPSDKLHRLLQGLIQKAL